MSTPKILVTEDMVINQVLAKVLFRNLGLKVTFASSGKESWELLMEAEVDIWFVDFYLPDMNAIQAVQGIEINPMPFLIMMSGKPFSTSELKDIDKIFPARIEKTPDQGPYPLRPPSSRMGRELSQPSSNIRTTVFARLSRRNEAD
jgi:CheY-like chemotaxis protein